ncbi:MAG: GntR domain protein [Frankiales bacterium]|nr:GntR domain protein [Frankiales bacterium]
MDGSSSPRPVRRPRAKLRQPRVAEMLADVLRDRILSGELEDDSLLPKQDDLLAEFRTSKASAREAFRILETEGLITVQRGNVGGAVVHRPTPETAAYMLGLVLQSRGVGLSDVGTALQYVEPLCAALCAGREDRATAVVPRLESAHQRLVEAVNADDEAAATPASRVFHEELVKCSGNETMIIVAGALESLWSAHEASWSVVATRQGRFPEPLLRKRALQEHEHLIAAIAAGDIDRAARTARKHLSTAQQYPLSDDQGGSVRAEYLRRFA